MASRSTIGKVAAMWLPIMTFFAHGYEHSIEHVLDPHGHVLRCPYLAHQWWIWNQIPVTLGNLVSGACSPDSRCMSPTCLRKLRPWYLTLTRLSARRHDKQSRPIQKHQNSLRKRPMVKPVEPITPLITQALRNFRRNSAYWLYP